MPEEGEGFVVWIAKLKTRLADRNLSAVSRACGWGAYRVSQMIGRGELPNVLDAIRLCRYLGVTVEDVFGEDVGVAVARTVPPAPRRLDSQAYVVARGRYRGRDSLQLIGAARCIEAEDYRGGAGWVPVLAPIAAGEPREAHDQSYPAGAAEAYVQFDTDDGQAFALTVDGDSMAPDFRHGDTVIASPKLGQGRDTYRDGMVAVVIFGGERTATLKRVRFGAVRRSDDEPMDYVLEPINPHFPKMRLRRVEISAIYPVIGLVRKEVV